jgi:hypothetical protein
MIEVTVTNQLSVNGSGVHWHGMRQFGTNEMDGTNGITECPIAPGSTKVYRFMATQYGSSVSQDENFEEQNPDSFSGITPTTPSSTVRGLLVPSSSTDLRLQTMMSTSELYQ